MMEILKMDWSQAEEWWFLQMVNTTANGAKTKKMVEELWNIPMEISIKVAGEMVLVLDKENTLIIMEINMKECG